MAEAEMSEELRLAQQQVLVNVGKSIVIFQSLESVLKTLTPFLPKPGHIDIDGIGSRHRKASKRMLGLLVEDFLSNSGLDSMQLRAQFSALLEHRNQLVHHFSQVHGLDFGTVEGCGKINMILTDQLAIVREHRLMLEGMRLAVLTVVCETTLRDTDDYHDMKALCLKLATALDPRYLPEVQIEEVR